MTKLTVSVYAPAEYQDFSGVVKVFLPGKLGDMTVLSGHSPLITDLVEGELEIFNGASPTTMKIDRGLAVIDSNHVDVFMET